MLVAPIASAQEKTDSLSNPSKNIFKITMLSLGSGSSRFTYERAFSDKFSAELTYGPIGMGWDWLNKSEPHGTIIKVAPKANLIPQKSADSYLAGLYVKPEFIFANFDYNVTKNGIEVPDNGPRQHTKQFALIAEAGYQLIAWDWFVFDIYVGLGPTWGTYNMNNYYHGFMIFPSDGRIAFTSGYRIGVAF